MVTSKDVNKEIRRVVWPALKEAGFTSFTARSAWRQHAAAIDVVNFQSFNSYIASVVGCTTFSFGVNLGVYYPAVLGAPWSREILRAEIADRPAEYQCQARNHLRKTIRQSKHLQKEIWCVDRSGNDIVEVVANARRVIVSKGLPWFDEFNDLRRALRHFFKPASGQYVATIGSIFAAEHGGALALALGDKSAARRLWKAVINNDFYARLPESLKEARRRIEQIDAMEIRPARLRVNAARPSEIQYPSQKGDH